MSAACVGTGGGSRVRSATTLARHELTIRRGATAAQSAIVRVEPSVLTYVGTLWNSSTSDSVANRAPRSLRK